MPQMMPINWLMLYFLFTIIFIIFIIMIYYNFFKYPSTNNKSMSMMKNNNLKMNWKW